jgi:flagellar biogenesis protein FliO
MFEILVSPEVMPAGTHLITVGYIFQLIISLGIVIGLIYFSAKYLFPKLQLPSHGQAIQILDRVGIEPQVTAYIISAYDRSYLIAVSNKGVTVLDKLESGS